MIYRSGKEEGRQKFLLTAFPLFTGSNKNISRLEKQYNLAATSFSSTV